MATLIKVLALVLVFSALGALRHAVPLFQSNSPADPLDASTTLTASNIKFDLSYEKQVVQLPMHSVSHYKDVKEGSLFFQHEDKKKYLQSPLLDTQVKMSVTGLIARAVVTQTFTNTSEDWVNGIYVFPLPSNAAVDHMEMRVGERHIVGEIHSRQKARKIYQQAKATGRKATLLEQERTNLFTNQVANIGPGESIRVTIEYQQAVDYEDGNFSLRFPMTITPRYIPEQLNVSEVDQNGWSMSPNLVTDADRITPPQKEASDSPNNIRIQVHVNPGFELEDIDSEFHQVELRKGTQQDYFVELKQPAIADRDFILNWRAAGSVIPQTAHFSQTFEGEEYGMVMLLPPNVDKNDLPSIPRDVMFVLDTSGSMAGESIRQAKLALNLAINQLTVKDRFNLIEFNSYAKSLWSFSREATHHNKQSAVQFVRGLESNGGTNMQAALEMAFVDPSDEKNAAVRQVIFITDGSVGNDRNLVSYIRSHLGQSRLFTVGIGSAPNGYFMREAARLGKGTFTFIGSISSVQDKMQALFEKLKFPVLTHLAADFGHNVEFYPSQLPDLYLGEPVMLSYKSNEKLNRLYLSGTRNLSSWNTEMPLISSAKRQGLNVLWARRKITQLVRDRMIAEDKLEINRAIENVAMKHHLVSEFTSLVAVDVTPTALDISQDKAVPNQTPHGKATAKFVGQLPQTATSAQLHLLLGCLLIGAALCFRIRQKNPY